eukprot:jgi/Ulvmu1/8900/UM049_0082.1
MRMQLIKRAQGWESAKALNSCPIVANSPRTTARLVSAHIRSTNGTSHWGGSNGNGATAQAEKTRTQELYVADLDMTIDTGDESYADRPATTMRVPHPSEIRHDRPANGGVEEVQLVRNNKALQAELASVRDELTVSQQENQHLHMQLAEKERTLQATKADLIETRLELQRTEARLTEVNDRLETATNERSEYRQYLLEAQQELQQTREELLEWSEGLQELKTVMEDLDGDLTDLFGEGDWSAVTDAIEATRSLRAPGDASDSNGVAAVPEEHSQSFAAALEDLHKLSAEVLRQAEEDRRLFGL